MNGKAPRRPRESKKEAACLCSRGGMRKCPRSVSNLSEGGQGTFSRRGKARRRQSSHGRARLQLHGPIRGYMRGKKRRKKGENPKRSVVLEGYITRLPLSYDPPPQPTKQSYTPLSLHTPPLPSTQVAMKVCAQVVVQPSAPPRLRVSAWAGAV